MLKIATPSYISIGLVGCITTKDPRSSNGLAHSDFLLAWQLGNKGGESCSRILRTCSASDSMCSLASRNYYTFSGSFSWDFDWFSRSFQYRSNTYIVSSFLAKSYGVSSLLVLANASAPCYSNSYQNLDRPQWLAICRAVQPPTSAMLMFAPQFTSSSTIWNDPSRHAMCNILVRFSSRVLALSPWDMYHRIALRFFPRPAFINCTSFWLRWTIALGIIFPLGTPKVLYIANSPLSKFPGPRHPAQIPTYVLLSSRDCN